MKRAQKESNKLKTYLGRVSRDIRSQLEDRPVLKNIFEPVLEIIDKVLEQKRDSKNKVYSIHEPYVECISKGKSHKKYEFGCKVSLVVTHKEGLALSTKALQGNPYDGHTLANVINDSERISGTQISEIFAYKGYRGHEVVGKEVHISGKRNVSASLRRHINRRQAIEANISHMKSEGKLERNYLKGRLGDALNAILCGIGHNLRLIKRKIESYVPRPCYH